MSLFLMLAIVTFFFCAVVGTAWWLLDNLRPKPWKEHDMFEKRRKEAELRHKRDFPDE